MTNTEIISFIRDEMLKCKELDAEFTWNIAKLAEFDNEVFELMQEWMTVTSEQEQQLIEHYLQCCLDEYSFKISHHTLSHIPHPNIRDQ